MRIADGRDEDTREGFGAIWRDVPVRPAPDRDRDAVSARKVGRFAGAGDEETARTVARFRHWLGNLRP